MRWATFLCRPRSPRWWPRPPTTSSNRITQDSVLMKSPMFVSESVTRPSISQPPSTLDTFLDRSFRGLTYAFAWLTILLMVYLLWRVGRQAAPAIENYGLHFLNSTTWDVNKGQFGVLPEIWGTLYSSLLALILGGFFGVAIAIFLTQDFLPPTLELVLHI